MDVFVKGTFRIVRVLVMAAVTLGLGGRRDGNDDSSL
jgi:hypothetical protein